MKLSLSSALLISALGSLVGCGVEVSGGDETPDPALDVPSESTEEAVAACGGAPAPECTFDQGVKTCVTTTQTIVCETRLVFAGCTAFNGTTFVPGQRVLTFHDQVLITATTTVVRKWHQWKVVETSTVTTREILSSTLISDVCTPL